MPSYYSVANTQAKSSSLSHLPGGKEGVKYLLQVLSDYPRAIVFKGYLYRVVYPLRLNQELALAALLLDPKQLNGLIFLSKGALGGLKIRVSPVRFWASAPKEKVANLNLVSAQFEEMSRSGGMVDAAVSKTVGGQPPCRFESDLRHHKEDAS